MMISPLYSTRRVRRVLRAALVTLVALTGCQGSLRSWRRDDPALRDLVVTPHPWDEPARDDSQRDSYDASARNRAAKNNMTRTKGGRANPYAADHSDSRRYEPSDDVAQVGAEDEESFEVEDAELRSIMTQVDPAHRATLVQLYQAVKAHRQNMADQMDEDAEAFVAEADQSDEPTQPASANKQLAGKQLAGKRAQAKSSPQNPAKKPSQSKPPAESEVGPAIYHYGDNSGDETDQVRPASGTRPIRPQVDALGNRSNSQPAHFTLSDQGADEDQLTDPAVQSNPDRSSRQTLKDRANKSRPQDIRPPQSNSNERLVHAPMADTGYVDPISSISQRGAREPDRTASTRKQSRTGSAGPNNQDEVDTHYTDPGYTDPGYDSSVVPASAESSPDATDVEPATIRPSSRNNTTSNHSNSAGATQAVYASTTSSRNNSNQASDAPTEDWRELAQKTLRSLDAEAVDSNASAQLNHHVTKRMLYVLLGQLNQALEPIPGLQPHEQEYFRHMFQAIHNSIDVRGNPVFARRWPLVMENQRTAMSHLGAVSNLEVKNAAFCSNVDGFGVITKFPSYKFQPNQQLLLYCEVENFVSDQIKDGYETKLRGSYEILDASQTRVDEVLLPEEVDVCKRPRRDYFFVYRIYTPKNIAPGRYQLRLAIEDVKGNKFGQTTLDLEIGG